MGAKIWTISLLSTLSFLEVSASELAFPRGPKTEQSEVIAIILLICVFGLFLICCLCQTCIDVVTGNLYTCAQSPWVSTTYESI